LIYADDEIRPSLPYEGTDPRVRGGPPGFSELVNCLQGAGQGADLAQRTQAERDCLLQCGAQGWRLDAEALRERLQERLGGGNEHDVFFDERSQRVIKVTLSTTGYGAQGNALSYLKNLDRCNRFFADAIRFEGLVRVAPTFDALVVSQPFVEGASATETEIEEYFVHQGYQRAGLHSFEVNDRSGRSYLIADARADNIIKHQASDLICPIDVQIIVIEPTS
jgi:hypothetical protein